MRGLEEGARAMIETDTPGIYAPVFCDGEKWVMKEKLGLSDCKVCIACSDDNQWHLVVCDTANNDGWKNSSEYEFCADKDEGRLAIKFVCGEDFFSDDEPNVSAGPQLGNPINIILGTNPSQ